MNSLNHEQTRPAQTAAETDTDRQRRMSRFSTLSSTPTVVSPPPSHTPAEAGASTPARPTIKEVVLRHPRNSAYALFLVTAFLGFLTGWIAYLATKETGGDNRNDRGLLVNAIFVVALISIFLMASRQFIFIYRLFQPISPNQTPSLPPWLVGRPPTYREALRTGGRGTGDVEDGIIAQNESLPKYGETIGSTLLARSQSRGGAVEMAERQREVPAVQQRPEAVAPEEASPRDSVDGVSRVDREREAERRQIEEARRLQSLPAYSAPPGQAPTQESRDEKWETVALEGR